MEYYYSTERRRSSSGIWIVLLLIVLAAIAWLYWPTNTPRLVLYFGTEQTAPVVPVTAAPVIPVTAAPDGQMFYAPVMPVTVPYAVPEMTRSDAYAQGYQVGSTAALPLQDGAQIMVTGAYTRVHMLTEDLSRPDVNAVRMAYYTGYAKAWATRLNRVVTATCDVGGCDLIY